MQNVKPINQIFITVEFAYISTSGGLQKSADIRELPM